MKKVFPYLIFLLTLISFQSKATHIVGGELYYEHLGNNNYRISLIVYRDCFLGQAGFDAPANLTIFRDSSTLVRVVRLYTQSVTNLPSDIHDSCFQVPSGVCVERGYYETVVNLPPIAGGYTISWQRCCRNNSIKNIITPGDWGSTITTNIPSSNVAVQNSSPYFVQRPPLAICLGSQFSFDHSAKDPDGDSLVYELCDVLHGGGKDWGSGPTSPKPDQATAPPYTTVTWSNGFTATNPIDANPGFSVDRSTGVLTGTPLSIGQYVFGICVSEYRNGVFIGMSRREYQVNVKACIPNTVADLQLPSPCQGLKDLTFLNSSKKASSYLWDFGVAGVTTDTSSNQTPTFSFPDSGTYTIRLIANPGLKCADTTTQKLKLYHELKADFVSPDGSCITSPSLDFQASGLYQPYTKFLWDFGPNANPTTDTRENPTGIVFNDTGNFIIRVQMEHGGCTSTMEKKLTIFPSIETDFLIRNPKGCAPLQVALEDRTKSWTDVHQIWTINGNILRDSIEKLVFTEPGEYVVSHQTFTLEGCKDTTPPSYKLIEVSKSPTAGFLISETELNIFNPEIEVIDQSFGGQSCVLFFGDESKTSDCEGFHTFTKPGKFKVSQIVSNGNGCSDTSSVYVNVENEFAFFLPNSFSPNIDGINEVFKPTIVGGKSIEFLVLDRWGFVVFQTEDLNEGWDGTRRNDGKPAPTGTYVYTVKVRDFLDEFHFYTGNVYLFR